MVYTLTMKSISYLEEKPGTLVQKAGIPVLISCLKGNTTVRWGWGACRNDLNVLNMKKRKSAPFLRRLHSSCDLRLHHIKSLYFNIKFLNLF